jgi:hypothetical protein
MRGISPKLEIILSEENHRIMEERAHQRIAPYCEVIRAKALLMAAAGLRNVDIARKLDTDPRTVSVWRKEFIARGIESLNDRHRPGCKGSFSPNVKAAVTCIACHRPGSELKLMKVRTGSEEIGLLPPREIAPFLYIDTSTGMLTIKLPLSRFPARVIAWCIMAIGLVVSISVRTVQRMLKAEKLKPWQFRSWITPKNLQDFFLRASDILDLYANVKTMGFDEAVFSIDEKTSIQARHHATYTPTGEGEPAHLEHTYVRRGAVNLLASLNVSNGAVLGQVYMHKTFQSFAEFLKMLITGAILCGKKIVHLILDNSSIHRPKYLGTWLSKTFPHVQVVVHWLPVRSSWLNQIEIFFSLLQTQALTPNNFPNTEAVVKQIFGYIDWHNLDPQPIKWNYTKDDLHEKYRAQRLDKAEYNELTQLDRVA